MNKQELLNELRKEGFGEEIISAFSKVFREDFISRDFKKYAYENEPLPIGRGATISQPYTIAFMLELLELEDNGDLRILEIGSGSGYVLALINEIVKNCDLVGIEINKWLVSSSREILKKDKNVKIICADGSKGLKEEMLDRILISASSDEFPEHLFEQLEEGGILVAPVKNSIFKFKKVKGKIEKREYPGFVFVPLVSEWLLFWEGKLNSKFLDIYSV